MYPVTQDTGQTVCTQGGVGRSDSAKADGSAEVKLTEILSFNPITRLPKGTDLPFIDMATLPTSGRVIPGFTLRENRGSGSRFQNGDTLFARITPCLENGKGGMVHDLPDNGLGHGSTEFIVMRAHRKAEEKFVYYVSRLPAFRNFAIQQMTGTSGRQRVAWQCLQNFEIVELSSDEREEIGVVLGSLDDKIDLNRRMNETLEAMARAFFRDWFVDFGPTRAKMAGRDPYLTPDLWALFPDTLDAETGLPKGWKQGVFADFAESRRRSINPAGIAGDTPYIGLKHMPRRSITLPEWECAGKVKSNKSAFRKGEFLFGKLRPYFHKVGIAPLDGICSTDIVVVVPRTQGWGAFTLACLSSDEFVEYTKRTSIGTRMPRTSWEIMGQYKVCLPSEQLAGALQNVTQSLLGRIVANVHESRTLAAIRDLLLPKRMSGEIRLRETEKVIEAGT